MGKICPKNPNRLKFNYLSETKPDTIDNSHTAMPTNLPPEYYEVEKRYKAASTTEEQIATLEELISTIPKHKGTEKIRVIFNKRLSKLKTSAQASKKTGRTESAFHIDREGAGQAMVVGMPNVGKSSLITALTNASPEVSPAPYTTWVPTPGMLDHKNIQVQLIDTPPLNRDHIEPQLLEMIRRCDLVLLVVDVQTYPLQQLEDALDILAENRIAPLRRKDQYADIPRMPFLPFIVVANKTDDEETDEVFDLFCEFMEGEWPCRPISAENNRNLEILKDTITEALDIIRVFSKPPGEAPDLSVPFTLKNGSTLEDLAGKVHKDFLRNLKSARVWGKEVHDGQLVGRDYILIDGDIVELKI